MSTVFLPLPRESISPLSLDGRGEKIELRPSLISPATSRLIKRFAFLSVLTVLSFLGTPRASGAAPTDPAATQAASEDEAWSLDDYKDICEATQFVMISVAIGVGLWWYFTRYAPGPGSRRLTFDVELRDLGREERSHWLEISCIVTNCGAASASVARLMYTVTPISMATLSQGSVAPVSSQETTLTEQAWVAGGTELEAGCQSRYAALVAVSSETRYVQVTGTLEQPENRGRSTVTRLIALGAGA